MLSQQMISVSQTSMNAALLQGSITSSTAMLRITSSLPRRSRPHHQIRTLRMGLWSSYLDPDFQTEVARRHRIMKYKYMESLNRKLSWDRQSTVSSRQTGLKGFMCSAWRGQNLRHRWVDVKDLSNSKEGQEKSFRGIEDVEQGALDKLLDHKDELYERVRARSRAWFMSPEDGKGVTANYSTEQHDSPRRASYNQDEFRRRFQRSQTHKSPEPEPEPEYVIDPITNRKVVKSRNLNNSRKPIDVPFKTFKDYRPQFHEFSPSLESTDVEFKTYKPLSVSEDTSESTRESLRDYHGDAEYKPFFSFDPDGQKPKPKSDGEAPSVQDSMSEYDRKISYGPLMYREPDGALPEKACPVQQGLQEYDDKINYGPLLYREPDGAVPEKACPVQQGLREYDGKINYGAVLYQEPEGRTPETQDPVAKGLQEFDQRTEYHPRRILKNTSLDRRNGNTDRSFRYPHEDTREDVDLLRPSDIRAASGKVKPGMKETQAEKEAIRSKLEKSFSQPEALTDLTRFSIDISELRNHTAHLQGKVDAKLAGARQPPRKMTGNFVRDFPEEFETKWTSEKEAASLKPDKQNFVQEPQDTFPKEFYARNPGTPRLQTSLDRTSDIPPRSRVSEKVRREEAEYWNKKELNTKIDMGLETGFDDVAAKERALELERHPYSKEPQGLETCYREEVKLQNEKDPYTKKPMGMETQYAEEVAAQQAEGDLSTRVSSFGNRKADSNFQNEQSIANQKRKAHSDLVQEIRTIYEDRHGKLDSNHRQIPESVVANKATTRSEISPEVPAAEAQEPTVYKILAYDPTMQEINTAETTSIVPDSASALTPAEVLLRISNPAKFFPHFQPLQSQGYEIVSGSGDVLVFRKVRQAGLRGSKNESASSIQRVSTNPIDGMQSSPVAATGNFASPTGFVNHDLPVSDPPFKSNIDVRREEPVFSGKSTWKDGDASSKSGKKGRGKRLLIGAAWVAGCSYAIGVVTEFFRTGGMDGLGSKSF